MPRNQEKCKIRCEVNGDEIGTNFFIADGNDSIHGVGGNDDIRTYGGNDTITGGDGADSFLFRQYYDQDVVTDFKDNVDKIELMNFAGVTNFVLAKSFAKQSGADVIFNFGNDDIRTVKNITVAALEDDLIFA